MKLTQRKGLGDSVRICDDTGAVVATFSNNGAGMMALTLFHRGAAAFEQLGKPGAISLFDADANRYIIGTLDQLIGQAI